MRRCVVDACVAAKWYFPEEGSDTALRLMPTGREGPWEVAAPELIVHEMGNLALRKVRLGEADEGTAQTVLSRFLALPVRMIAASRELALAALEVGSRLGIGYYDAWYLALAVSLDAVLVTADRELVEMTRSTPLAGRVQLLSQLEN